MQKIRNELQKAGQNGRIFRPMWFLRRRNSAAGSGLMLGVRVFSRRE